MSGDVYDKANKVVNELKQQVKDNGIKFLKAICNFLLNQNKVLNEIDVKRKCQLESQRIYYTTLYNTKLKFIRWTVFLVFYILQLLVK